MSWVRKPQWEAKGDGCGRVRRCWVLPPPLWLRRIKLVKVKVFGGVRTGLCRLAFWSNLSLCTSLVMQKKA